MSERNRITIDFKSRWKEECIRCGFEQIVEVGPLQGNVVKLDAGDEGWTQITISKNGSRWGLGSLCPGCSKEGLEHLGLMGRVAKLGEPKE